MKKVLGVLAVAGLASSAMAQSFEGQIAFRSDHTASTAPNIGAQGFTVSATGTYNFSVLAGAFNAQGFTNAGLFNWLGTVDGAGAGTFGTTPGNRLPFNANPVGGGVGSPTGIAGIDSARNVVNIEVPWPEGEPQPGSPVFTQGNGQFFSIYRFTVTVSDLTARDVTITAGGPMQAISGWTFIGGEEGAVATYTATSFVTDASTAGSFVLHIVPAPGAAALLGLGGLVAARRRRA